MGIFDYKEKIEDYFVEMDDAYRQRNFPKGFFASQVKKWRIGWVYCTFSIALFLYFLSIAGSVFLRNGIAIRSFWDFFNMARILGAIIISTVLFIPLIKTWKAEGIKGESEIIQKYMESSGMSQSDLQEFARQVMEPGTKRIWLKGEAYSLGGRDTGIMTRDFIWFQQCLCVLKKSDIKLICFYESTHTEYSRGGGISLYHLWIDLLVDKERKISAMTEKAAGEFLIEFIRECNPEVDTMEGRVLTEEEHEKFYEKLMHDEIEYKKWFKGGFDDKNGGNRL